MSFISPASHKKFILQCQSLINKTSAEEQADEKTERLKADLTELQKLIEMYSKVLSQLPGLAHEYNLLHRRIRVNIRKIQLDKRLSSSKK